MTDTKNIPAPYDWKTLADDMKNNGKITQNFFENAQSVHALIAQEAAHNLHYYFEYAKIFVDNEHDALDLVQHAFEKSLEKPDYFEGKLESSPQTIILSHIQEKLEELKNERYALTQAIIKNKTIPHTESEKEHLTHIQFELAKTLSELPDEDAAIVIEYMENVENTDLPEFLKDKLAESEGLPKLHFNGTQQQKPQL